MKMKIVYCLLMIAFLLLIAGHTNNNENHNSNQIKKDKEINHSNEVIQSVKIIINEKEYSIDLDINETTNEFISMFPLELTMNDLNKNEKYAYLDDTLPTNPFNPKRIHAGDVMLYGDNCLVIFYKSFETSYSYTKIGHINHLPDLGNESISIKLEK